MKSGRRDMQYDQPIEEREAAYENLNRAREALSRTARPTGLRTSPGQTCKDIKQASPQAQNDYYWVDPNEGSAMDAIQVYCDFETEETCLIPQTEEYTSQRWTKDTKPGFFMEDINNGKEFCYQNCEETDAQQIKFLQLLSSAARQTITYNCLNSSPKGAILAAASGDDLKSSKGRFKRSTVIQVHDDCVSDNQWHTAQFTVRTNKTEILPIVDIKLHDVGKDNQQFGVEVGLVCFR